MTKSLADQYETIIGIECHVQLATKSKLFCACDNDSREAEPNTHICEICTGQPGALPVLNKRAVELALRLGKALNAEYPVALHTKFDRKNYFYPDLPKGYQITQFDEPIVPNGWVEFPLDGKTKRVGITRAHLEGDAGKLSHPDGADYSLVDLNRAETPLLEIVSEPDMRSAAEAKAYAQELYNLARYSDASDANLYYGNMRFDVNVSVHQPGTPFGTRTETKNLNSFRNVERAVEYEVERQIEALKKGENIRQETRGWNEAKQRTYAMRSKEDADEYRYFPEPDLPPLVIPRAMADAAGADMMLPNDLRALMAKAGLPSTEIEVVVGSPDLATLWHDAYKLDPKRSRFVFNWLVNSQTAAPQQHAEQPDLEIKVSDTIKVEDIVEVAVMADDGELSSSNAKTLLAKRQQQGKNHPTNLHDLAREMNLIQQSNEAELAKIVEEVITANPGAVADYKSGNARALGALVGGAMKATQGKGNPPLITKLLKQKLDT